MLTGWIPEVVKYTDKNELMSSYESYQKSF